VLVDLLDLILIVYEIDVVLRDVHHHHLILIVIDYYSVVKVFHQMVFYDLIFYHIDDNQVMFDNVDQNH
jgi:hypothetical protein